MSVKVSKLFANEGVYYPTAACFTNWSEGISPTELTLQIAEARMAKLEADSARPANLRSARELARRLNPELVGC